MTTSRPDVFLSYSREDQAIARRYAEGLQREGLRVWWDQALNPGEAFDQVTEKALEEARAVVVLWSTTSVNSRWVRAEATQAAAANRLVPVMIEPCKRPIMFELTHTADLSRWKGNGDDQAWRAFVQGVRRYVSGDAGGASAEPPQPSVTEPPAVGRWGRRIALIAGVLLVVAGAVWVTRRESPGSLRPASGEQVTLAVLPFADISSARDQEVFAEGLTEEILNQLAQNQRLRVTGRTSSFSFKDHNEDLREIGRRLGVAHLLGGSIRKEGNRLAITAQLMDASDGARRWSRTYERELAGVFALQEEIAKDVARALSVSLDAGEVSRSSGGTTNVAAYEKYLLGRQLEAREGIAELRQAADVLRGAVELDPQFSLAWLELANVLEFSGMQDPENRAVLQQERDAAAARVYAIAPRSAGARFLHIVELMREYRWLEAEKAARESERMLGEVLVRVGRLREALPTFERELRADPLSRSVSNNMQVYYDTLDRPDLAQAEYERSKGLVGFGGRADHFALLRMLKSGTATEAQIRAQFETFLRNAPLPMKLDRDLAAHWQDQAAARSALRAELDTASNKDSTRLLILAMTADAFGDRQTALQALRRFAASKPLWYTIGGIWYSYGTGLRSDPEFKEVLRDLKLVDYYRAGGNWGDFCKPLGPDDFECH